jgi:hypothetical protein
MVKLMLDYLSANWDKNYPKLKKLVWRLMWVFLITFLLTIPILFWGIMHDSKTAIVTSGMIRAALTLILLGLISVIIAAVQKLSEPDVPAIKRTLGILRSVCIGELIFTAVMAWLPLKNDLDKVLLFSLLCAVTSFLVSKEMSKKFSQGIVLTLLILTTASFLAPYSMQALGRKLSSADQGQGMPVKINPSCAELKGYKFFGPDGEPMIYYYFNSRTARIEVYELMSKNTTHPSTGDQLMPITKEVRYKLEDEVCKGEVAAKQKEEAEKRKAELDRQREETERKKEEAEKQKAEALAAIAAKVQREAAAEKSNKIQYAILSEQKTGDRGKNISSKIATSLPAGIFLDASAMDYQAACQKVRFLIVLESVKTVEKTESSYTICNFSLFFKIVNTETGQVTKRITASEEKTASDFFSAERASQDEAIKTARNQIKALM